MALHELALKSNDSDVKVRKKPLGVIAGADVGIGKLMLVPLADQIKIHTTKQGAPFKPSSGMYAFEGASVDYAASTAHAYVKQSLVFPSNEVGARSDVQASKDDNAFIVGFWGVDTVTNPNNANMDLRAAVINIKIGSSPNVVIRVPFMVNNQEIKTGESLKLFVGNTRLRDPDQDENNSKAPKVGRLTGPPDPEETIENSTRTSKGNGKCKSAKAKAKAAVEAIAKAKAL